MGIYDGKTPEQIEAYRKYHREYNRAHREAISQRKKENRIYNHEHVLRREKAWRMANADKVSAANRRSNEKRKRRIGDLEAQNAELQQRVAELEAWIDEHIKA